MQILSGGTTTLGVYDFKAGLNEFGKTDYWSAVSGGHPLNKRVMLSSGVIVQSTIPANTNNPNTNMTGWILEPSIGAIYNPLNAIFKPEQLNSTNFTSTLYSLMAEVSSNGGGTISIPDGLFEVDASVGLTIPDDVHLVMGKGTTIKPKPFTVGSYELIRIHDVKYVS